jgi:signal transduction histidine kinase
LISAVGRRAWLRTLQGRLVATYAAVALLAVCTSAIAIAGTLRTVVIDRIGVDLVGEANLLADHLREPLSQGNLSFVDAYVDRVDPLTTAHILVVDRSGRTVAASLVGLDSGDDRADELSQALTGETVVSTAAPLIGQGTIVRVAVPVRSATGEIVGAVLETYNFDDLQEVFWQMTAAAMLGAIGAAIPAGLVGLYYARQIARPVQRVASAALFLANGRPVSPLDASDGGTQDVNDLIRAFNSLMAQLDAHERAQGEFASDVSHELHSLASAMQTAADALERGSDRADAASSRRLVAGLVGHTRRLNRLASDLLELARWEGGRLQIEPERLDAADLVHGVLDEWVAEAERRTVSLQVDVQGEGPAIYGDPVRLAQALGNLVENALKYAGSGGSIRIDVRSDPKAGVCDIAIQDSGPGIAPESVPRIFDRYYRVEGRAAGGPGGMGLGLAIARGIARAHGGDVFVERVSNVGARFVLRLPVASDARPGAPDVQ